MAAGNPTEPGTVRKGQRMILQFQGYFATLTTVTFRAALASLPKIRSGPLEPSYQNCAVVLEERQANRRPPFPRNTSLPNGTLRNYQRLVVSLDIKSPLRAQHGHGNTVIMRGNGRVDDPWRKKACPQHRLPSPWICRPQAVIHRLAANITLKSYPPAPVIWTRAPHLPLPFPRSLRP